MAFGLTPQGFAAKSLQQIKSEIETSLRAVFGQNINLAANSNFGQLVGIFSEREALLWELAQAVYASQYPNGAEGTSVDNILALNNMRRLAASPSFTNPSAVVQQPSGIIFYGLLLFGVAGTVIPAGAIVETTDTPPLQFALNDTYTLLPAVNEQQNIFLSNVPTMGQFQLSIASSGNNTLWGTGDIMLTPLIEWDALADITKINFSAVPTLGSFQIRLTIAGDIQTTANISFAANAAAVQAAINLLPGYGGVTVTGSFAAGFSISWNGIPNPATTIPVNTLDVIPTPVDSVQSAINGLFDPTFVLYPYTDAVVTPAGSGFLVTFGAGPVFSGQPSSAEYPQAIFSVQLNSMQMGIEVTNIQVVKQAQGTPPYAIASATCLTNGPNFVSAFSFVIGSPQVGWTEAVNFLDVIQGTNVENDVEALTRRAENLQANANGPLGAIIQKVRAVPNVITAIGFENLDGAAFQDVVFASVPVAGNFQLVLNSVPTAALPFNATDAQIQTALQAIPGYGDVIVTGSIVSGFEVNFNGSMGGQPQGLMSVINNTTGVAITTSFGLPAHSVEIVAKGGSDEDIARAILNSKPGGIQSYGDVTVIVDDEFGNPRSISFSRPTEVPIYVKIVLTTDLTSDEPTFNPGSITDIQDDIVDIGTEVGIGGLIIGFGSNGLIGAFNEVPGIISYTMFFDRAPNPTTNTNIQMESHEEPNFESFNISVSYT